MCTGSVFRRGHQEKTEIIRALYLFLVCFMRYHSLVLLFRLHVLVFSWTAWDVG